MNHIRLRIKFIYFILILTNAQNSHLQRPGNDGDSTENVPAHFWDDLATLICALMYTYIAERVKHIAEQRHHVEI